MAQKSKTEKWSSSFITWFKHSQNMSIPQFFWQFFSTSWSWKTSKNICPYSRSCSVPQQRGPITLNCWNWAKWQHLDFFKNCLGTYGEILWGQMSSSDIFLLIGVRVVLCVGELRGDGSHMRGHQIAQNVFIMTSLKRERKEQNLLE